jgi:hypothetical protein
MLIIMIMPAKPLVGISGHRLRLLLVGASGFEASDPTVPTRASARSLLPGSALKPFVDPFRSNSEDSATADPGGSKASCRHFRINRGLGALGSLRCISDSQPRRLHCRRCHRGRGRCCGGHLVSETSESLAVMTNEGLGERSHDGLEHIWRQRWRIAVHDWMSPFRAAHGPAQ